MSARVAATGGWTADDGARLPAGEVHAWEPGQNQTLCGVPLHRAGLRRFAGVAFTDVDPATGGSADAVREVCPRCLAATGASRRGRHPRWQRTDPRP
ncbi:hypothetical protein [Kineococcus terrestris]|uniref:hypothetical protein n=1 Tax=Kineococcus terrestris TaxID=2044856 RepID=UPI0034DB2F71